MLLQRKRAARIGARAGEGHEWRIERLYVRGTRVGARRFDEGELVRADRGQRNLRRTSGPESAQIDHAAALRVEEVDHRHGRGSKGREAGSIDRDRRAGLSHLSYEDL